MKLKSIYKDLLEESLNTSSVVKLLNKWIGSTKLDNFPKFVFSYCIKMYPESKGRGKIYRYLNIDSEIFTEYGETITINDPQYGSYETSELINKFDEKIRKYIFTQGSKQGYSSWSSSKEGIKNFIDLLYNSGKFGEQGPGEFEILLISQNSEYLDLQKLPLDIKKDEIEMTDEVIAILRQDFKIEGYLSNNKTLIPYRGNIKKLMGTSDD